MTSKKFTDQETRSLNILFKEQRDARDNKEWDIATERVLDVQYLLMKDFDADQWASMSRITYEAGMVKDGWGEYKSAAFDFEASGVYAERAGDNARWLVGLFRKELTLYLAGMKSADDAYAALSNVREKQSEIANTIHSGNQSPYENNVFNTLKRLYELCFELDLGEFDQYCALILDHRFMLDTSPGKPAMYVLLELQIAARKAMREGRHDDAVGIFASYLDMEGVVAAEHPWQQALDRIKELLVRNVPEIVRDYRDFGRAMLSSSYDNKKALANRICEEGLKVPDTNGNTIFLSDIQTDLQK